MTRPRTLLAAPALLLLALPAAPHGGAYRAPATPGPAASPFFGGGVPTLPSRPAGAAASPFGPVGPDLSGWDQWWPRNQASYLALKTHVRSPDVQSGGAGWFLGDGERVPSGTLAPSASQVRAHIVPALLKVLEEETNTDLLSGALVALAKIGDDGSAADAVRFEQAMARFLADPNQELRETAALALGILASPRVIPTLAHLAWNTSAGRKRVQAAEVDYRTRAFAVYGLGLVGARTGDELVRQQVVTILRRTIEDDDTRSSDLEVACIVALGLVPLATLASPPAGPARRARAPESGRLAQLDFVLAILRDEARDHLARAQCPVTLARLFADLGEPQRSAWRERIAAELLERIEKDRVEVGQSCVIALGLLGTNDGKDPLDARIRRALLNVPRQVSEPQARAFALIAAAESGSTYGAELPGAGIDAAKDFLLDQLVRGKNALQPWGALASGVLARRIQDAGMTDPALASLQRALKSALEDEGSPERVGAFALGAGLAGSRESAPRLMKLLEKELQEDARGQVALALALLGHVEAIDPLRAILARSKYRPALLRDCAIALGILGDKDVGPQLVGMLAEARSLAAQAALATALGTIGDRAAVEPLLALLGDRLATDKARAFAAVALGSVADKEALPWNAKIARDLNYRAAPATLSDPLTGTGVLDLY